MVSSISKDILDAVVERAVELVMDNVTGVLDLMLDEHGLAFGDSHFTREERIAYVVDLADRGVLDVLKTVSPKQYEAILHQYNLDIKASELA